MGGRRGPQSKETSLRPYLVVYAPHTGVSDVCEAKNVPLLFQNKECVWKMCSFDRGHCLHDVIHVIKWTKPPSSIFAYCKQWMVGRPGKIVHCQQCDPQFIVTIACKCNPVTVHSLLIHIAMKPVEVQEKLALTKLRDRQWYVQPSCATSGDGLYEGLTWLTSNHKSK